MEGATRSIHVAAMYEVGIPAKQHPAMYEANVRGTERVLRAVLDAKVRKVVYVSTVGIFGNTHRKVVDETYGHPGREFTSYYEETKLEAHRIAEANDRRRGPARRHRPARRRLRPRRHLPGRRPAQRILRRPPASLLPFPDLGICLTHVEDIAGGILLALDKGKVGETYVISGPVTTMRDAIETVAGLSAAARRRSGAAHPR